MGSYGLVRYGVETAFRLLYKKSHVLTHAEVVAPKGGAGSTTDGADDQDDCLDKQRRNPLSENVERHVPARQCRHGAAEGAHVIARQPAALKGDREWVWADPSGDAL